MKAIRLQPKHDHQYSTHLPHEEGVRNYIQLHNDAMVIAGDNISARPETLSLRQRNVDTNTGAMEYELQLMTYGTSYKNRNKIKRVNICLDEDAMKMFADMVNNIANKGLIIERNETTETEHSIDASAFTGTESTVDNSAVTMW